MDAKIRAHLAGLRFRPNGPVEDSELRTLQHDIAIGLPAEYMEFMKATGGGRFGESIVCRCRLAPPMAPSGLTSLGKLLGLSALVAERRRFLKLGESPSLVPIADAPGGDHYCLGLGGPAIEVVYWDHDSGESYVVAESFYDLVTRLEVDQDRPDVGDVDVWLDPELL